MTAVALLWQGAVLIGCDTGKTGDCPFGDCDSTGSGGTDTDGGADTGSTGGGDTGSGPIPPGSLSGWLKCSPTALDDDSDDHFPPTDGYEDPLGTGETGLECHCSIDLAAIDYGGGPVQIQDVRVRGTRDATAEANELDGQPRYVGIEVPWLDDADDRYYAFVQNEHYDSESTGSCGVSDLTGWCTQFDDGNVKWKRSSTGAGITDDDVGLAASTPSAHVDLDAGGTLHVWLSERQGGGVGTTEALFGACDTLNEGLPVEVKLTQASEIITTDSPPPRPVNPLDVDEDDMACTGGTSGTTTFKLVDLPGMGRPTPIGVAGSRNYVETELTQVTVLAWNNTDQVVVRAADGTSVTLTPSNASASLPSDTYWFGTTTFLPGRTADDTTVWHHPTLSISHSCPTSRTNGERAVDQGYALTLGALDGAIDTATGGAGLSDVVTSTAQSSWPVYVVRVDALDHAATNGPTHALILEAQGTQAYSMLPLQQTAFGKWSLNSSGASWAVQGTVERKPGYLQLKLTSGNVGALSLSQTTLNLPVYP